MRLSKTNNLPSKQTNDIIDDDVAVEMDSVFINKNSNTWRGCLVITLH